MYTFAFHKGPTQSMLSILSWVRIHSPLSPLKNSHKVWSSLSFSIWDELFIQKLTTYQSHSDSSPVHLWDSQDGLFGFRERACSARIEACDAWKRVISFILHLFCSRKFQLWYGIAVTLLAQNGNSRSTRFLFVVITTFASTSANLDNVSTRQLRHLGWGITWRLGIRPAGRRNFFVHCVRPYTTPPGDSEFTLRVTWRRTSSTAITVTLRFTPKVRFLVTA